jgi:hypothetical protein
MPQLQKDFSCNKEFFYLFSTTVNLFWSGGMFRSGMTASKISLVLDFTDKWIQLFWLLTFSLSLLA